MSRFPIALRTLSCLLAVLALLLPGAVLAGPKYRIAIIPKLVGISYYDAVKRGVDQAARELPEVEVIWSGPTQDQVDKQIELIERLIPSQPSLIAVAANDPVAIVPVLKKAQAAGIHVMSWDGDTGRREFFVNLVDFNDFGSQLVDAMIDETGPNGELAIITTSFTAPNQSSWITAMKKQLNSRYPGISIADIRPAGESTEEAYRIAQDYLKTMPRLKGIFVLGAPNPPGVARAVKEAGLTGKVAVVGNSTPNLMRAFLKDGTVKKVLLWNAPDHGYLTVHAAYQLLRGGLAPGQPFNAGRLGKLTPRQDGQNMQVALPVLVFTSGNVDQYRF